MQIGKLDRQIVLGRKGVTRDSLTGSEIETFVTYATVWAAVQPARTGIAEKFIFEREALSTVLSIVIRYRSDVLSTDRVTFDGANYDIVLIAPVGERNRKYISLTAVNYQA